MKDYQYIVIGNSAGGLAAARAIRMHDQSGDLLIVGEEPYRPYSRPLIAKHISHGTTIEAMELVPAEFFDDNGIEWWPNTRAVHIDPYRKVIRCEDGREVRFQKVLLATGSLPIVPTLDGATRRGVHTFTTYNDAEAIARSLPAVRRAVVIGGGFIGLSAADALRHRGIHVTVVEMQPRLLSTMLDEEGSARVGAAVRSFGTEVVMGRRVVSINGPHPESASVSSVTLDDGTRRQCDMVILAIGVRPRTELAKGLVSVNHGILVDESMRTTEPGVFACGDVCRTRDYARDADAVLANWPNAVAGGAVAGAAMAGLPSTYEGSTTMNAVPYFGLSVASAGVVDPDPTTDETIIGQKSSSYIKVVLRDGFVAGMVSVGDTSKSGILHLLMRRRVKVDGWKDVLVQPDFGLLSLPDSLWRDEITAVN